MSQACAKIWRKDFMPPETVAIIPSQGYVNEKKYSIKGIRWIQSIAMTTGSRIMHALNGGEQKVAGMFVDGFDPVNKTVYEMLGCLFHGCLSCYTDRQMKNPFNLFSMDYLYKETFKKIEKLKKKNFKVVHIWEHDFDKRCKEDAVYKSLIDSLHPNREPLRPRDSLYGGRTNAVKLYHEVTGTEEIKYLDICSLYPYICKYGIFPIGHPLILTKEQIDMDRIREYEGLIKCTILPPSNLYHPVLPFKRGKFGGRRRRKQSDFLY